MPAVIRGSLGKSSNDQTEGKFGGGREAQRRRCGPASISANGASIAGSRRRACRTSRCVTSSYFPDRQAPSGGSGDSLWKLAKALQINVGDLLDVKPDPDRKGSVLRIWVPDTHRAQVLRLIAAILDEQK
jgi:hypothetical protein